MQKHSESTTLNPRMIADAFLQMTCAAFCAGLAVSVIAAAAVLLIAAIGR